MFLKKAILASAAAIIVSSPLLAQAAGSTLRIVNNTNQPSTVQLTFGTNKTCSTKIPGIPNGGVTAPHSYMDLTSSQLTAACNGSSLSACPAEVFMTKDCSGPLMGTVKINVSTGVYEYALTQAGINAGYSINLVNPFYVEINGGA